MPVWDPIVVLKMPGCIVRQVCFPDGIEEFLSPLIAARDEDSFYTLLGDAPPAVDLCSLETMYRDLRYGAQSPQTQIVAVRLRSADRCTANRTYTAFLAHAKLISETNMHVRLLAFPRNMPIWITDVAAGFVTVQVPGVFMTRLKNDEDRAVLATALPQLLANVEADTDLTYAPVNDVRDRDRYFKLHIPLRDLEDEDRCFGWLPAERAYSD